MRSDAKLGAVAAGVALLCAGPAEAQRSGHCLDAARLSVERVLEDAQRGPDWRLNWQEPVSDAATLCQAAAPSDAEGLTALATAELLKSYLDGAPPSTSVELLEQVVASAPDLTEAWALLGLARHLGGEREAALSAYERVEALSPEFLDIQAFHRRVRDAVRAGESRIPKPGG